MATQGNINKFFGGFAKLLREEWQADLLLKAGDTEHGAAISVHKLVLAAISEVFKKMFETDQFKASDGKIETVTLFELNHEELEAFVESVYMIRYTNILSEKQKKSVRSLYIAADKYDIPYLRDLCRSELISSFHSSNVFDIIELSMIPLDEALYNSAVKFAARNLREICDTVEFKAFVGRNLDLSVEILKASLTRRWNGEWI